MKYIMKTLFTDYNYIQPDEGIQTTEFWSWLTDYTGSDSFIPAIIDYLADRGFDMSHMKLDPEQVAIHKTVFEHYWWHRFKEA